MSAFVVEDKTINNVLSYLQNDNGGYLKRLCKDAGYEIDSYEGIEALGNACFELNCQSVNVRYGDASAREFRDLLYKVRFSREVSPILAYKSLSCLLYQCSEGKIPEQSELYKLLELVQKNIADNIVRKLPEYDRAPWN